ncbi:penicillin-binding transpeptidase domain-containing protein [Limosilactobacillus mucosae]|jgi:penicillin-binding protein 2B|uniref:penicillin-binding transpeptidase domain-containing protein n=1 Tax=Limosilactobacillus mucosae TaxID=97478 RepID=UPI003EB7F42B
MKQQQRTIGKNQKNRKMFGIALFLTFFCIFVLFVVRFFVIATTKDVQNRNLQTMASRMYTSKRIIEAKRGTIYDAQGNALAQDTKTYTVTAVLSHQSSTAKGKPNYVTNKKKAAKVLAKYLDITEKKALSIMSPKRKNVYQVEFGAAGSNISVSTMKKIKAQHVTGLQFTSTPARQYPAGEFASQLIGLATAKTNDKTGQTKLVGRLGLESYFNKNLTGINGLKEIKQDVYGYQLADSQVKGRPAKDGADVYTTLDNRTQQQLETLITKAEKETQASSMTAVVMEAKTGKILAATQRPNVNSSTPVWRNALVQDTYEPGSTMKVLALAAAIDSGNFNPEAVYKSGTWELGGGKITDWNTAGWGNITYKEGFYRSSNVAFAHIEQDMGSATWKKYIQKFGLLKNVGIYGMSGESKGYTSYKGTLEQANTAFGQGITVNVMQMMQAFSAIANNGTMVKPYFIKKIVASDGKTLEKTKPQTIGHPVSQATAKKVLHYMQGVIYNKNGTGQVYKISGYRIAGKTGTAQIGSSHGYETGSTNYLYSFVGMAPAKNPKYVVYITMKQPQHITKAAEQYMAEVVNPVTKQLLDRATAKDSKHQGVVKLPNVVGMSAADAQKKLQNKKLNVVVLGNGKKVKKQSAAKGSSVIINERVFLLTGGQVTMPDISGWSQADVSRFAQLLRLKLKSTGGGYAVSQSIKANTVLKEGDALQVRYKAK